MHTGNDSDGRLGKPAAAALAATALVAPALASLKASPSRSVLTMAWYALLQKPRFNPPNAVFPIAWTAVDGLLAAGAYRLARARSSPKRNRALALFAANVALISTWSRLFSGHRKLGPAAANSVVLAATATAYFSAARKVDREAAMTAVPLVAWVGFAMVLSIAIWRLNKR